MKLELSLEDVRKLIDLVNNELGVYYYLRLTSELNDGEEESLAKLLKLQRNLLDQQVDQFYKGE